MRVLRIFRVRGSLSHHSEQHHSIMGLCRSMEQVFRVIRGMTFLPRLRTPCEQFNVQCVGVPNAHRTIVQALSKSVQTLDSRVGSGT